MRTTSDVSKIVSQWKKVLRIKPSRFEKKSAQSWQRKLLPKTEAACRKALSQSTCIMVGDHRINTAQVVQWISMLTPQVDKKWKFMTDRFDTEQQKMIEAYMQGQCSQKNILDFFALSKPLDHCPEGGIGLVLQWLKQKKIKIDFITPTGSFEQQTRRIYRKLSKYQHKGHVLVWTGSLKVAPTWAKTLLQSIEGVMLLNMDSGAHYQACSQAWLAQGPYWISTKHDPCVSLELTRIWQEEIPVFVYPDEIKNTLHAYMATFQNVFKQPAQKIAFDLVSPFKPTPARVGKKIDGKIQKFIAQRIRRMESAVIPQHRLIVISRLDQASLAEEAMHYLRLHESNEKQYGPWVTIWEEAWGMFGSLLVDPAREIENKEAKEVWESVHLMGYALGKAMFEAWKSNKKRAVLREAFTWVTHDEGQAEIFVENMQILLWA